MVFAEPRPLQHGARHGNFFKVLEEFWDSARFTTAGPVVEVYCFDGELFTALQKLISGKRSLLYQMADQILAPRLVSEDLPFLDVPLLKATHFQLFVKCTSHSLSNGMKLGLSRWASDNIIDDLYIAISSCIKCSSDIMDHLETFAGRVVYDDPQWTPDDWSARQILWKSMSREMRLARESTREIDSYSYLDEDFFNDGVPGLVEGMVRQMVLQKLPVLEQPPNDCSAAHPVERKAEEAAAAIA